MRDVFLYDSRFYTPKLFWCGYALGNTPLVHVVGCTVDSWNGGRFAGVNSIIKDLRIHEGATNALTFASPAPSTVTGIAVYRSVYGIYWNTAADNIILSNVLGESNTYAMRVLSDTAGVHTMYLVDCAFDNWNFNWTINTGTAQVYRQHTFNLTVTDKENMPLPEAAVTLTDKDGAEVFSAVTNENGAIPTQTVTRGFYQQTTGNTLQDQSPHTLTAKKNGYQTYTKKFTLTEKTKWAIKLSKARQIRFGQGTLVVDTQPSNPESFFVLSLG